MLSSSLRLLFIPACVQLAWALAGAQWEEAEALLPDLLAAVDSFTLAVDADLERTLEVLISHAPIVHELLRAWVSRGSSSRHCTLLVAATALMLICSAGRCLL